MLISTRTHYLGNAFSEKQAIKMIADAGFTAFDMSLFNLTMNKDWCFNNDDYLEQACNLKEYADSLGIVCNQAHAPFPSSTGEEKKDAEIYRKILRSIEIASVFGAKIIVVHPLAHLSYAEHSEELFKMNVEFFKRLIPYAEKYNIIIAAENIFTWSGGIKECTGSRADELCRLIDEVNSPYMVACFDIGHAALFNTDIPEFIKKLGAKRLQALHVHDNDLQSDMHTMPYTQKIDYDAVIKALAEIGYRGDFTYEACGFFRSFSTDLWFDALKFMCTAGKAISEKIK